MKRYKTLSTVTLGSGNLLLTAHQAGSRMNRLSTVDMDNEGNGIFSISSPIQFKAGEEFGYDGDIPKSLADSMEEIEVEQEVETRKVGKKTGRGNK